VGQIKFSFPKRYKPQMPNFYFCLYSFLVLSNQTNNNFKGREEKKTPINFYLNKTPKVTKISQNLLLVLSLNPKTVQEEAMSIPAKYFQHPDKKTILQKLNTEEDLYTFI